MQAWSLSRHSAAGQQACGRGAAAAGRTGAASELSLLSRCTYEIAWEHAHVFQGHRVNLLA